MTGTIEDVLDEEVVEELEEAGEENRRKAERSKTKYGSRLNDE